MEFLHPYFLLGFSALIIPVLIHLFNLRRYKKEYFTNVRFLSQIQMETKKRSKLKQLLVLLTRLLAVSAIVMAFAQPFISSAIKGNNKAGFQAVSVYVDNSFSMEAGGKQGRLLDLARKKASEIVSAYKSSDVFQLMTNDFESRHSQFVSREEFLALLKEVRISYASVNLKDIINRQKDFFSKQKEGNCVSFIISDMQKSTTGLTNLRPDSSAHYIIVPVESNKQNNLFIDSAWFATPVHRPGEAVKLVVRIKNCGSERLEKIPLRLTINNNQKAVTSFSIDASGSAEIPLPYTEEKSGFQLGRLEIADYPVTYDDIFYFSYVISKEINVLNIYGKTPDHFFSSLFSLDSIFHFQQSTETQVDYNSFNKQNLIILNSIQDFSSGLSDELQLFLKKGGTVCVFPDVNNSNEKLNSFLKLSGAPIFGKNDTMKQRVASVDLENLVFKEVFDKDAAGKIHIPENADLPSVSRYCIINNSVSNPAIILMRLQNGFPFLASSDIGKGKLYLFASSLDASSTNFQQHLLFVPVMFRIAFLSNIITPLYYITDKNEILVLPSDSMSERNPVKIKKWQSSYEFIPEIRNSGQTMQVIIHEKINESGWYTLYQGNKEITVLAFNYNRKESDLSSYTVQEVEAGINKFNLTNFVVLKSSGISLTRQVEQLNLGFPLSKWLILLTLLFLLAEVLIIRTLRS